MTMSIRLRVGLKDKNVMTEICHNFFSKPKYLPADVSKSCTPSECCPQTFNKPNRYSRAKVKTYRLPEYMPLTSNLFDLNFHSLEGVSR